MKTLLTLLVAMNCHVAKTGQTFSITPQTDSIAVTGNDDQYSASYVSLTPKQAKIALSNMTDGPLAQDLLIFSTTALKEMAQGTVPSIKALDVYSEQFDGTTQRMIMTCEVIP